MALLQPTDLYAFFFLLGYYAFYFMPFSCYDIKFKKDLKTRKLKCF